MYKVVGVVTGAIIATALVCPVANALPGPDASTVAAMQRPTPGVTLAWDNCGVGFHRNMYGRCISNFVHDTRGCPPGFHLGYHVHRCIPTR